MKFGKILCAALCLAVVAGLSVNVSANEFTFPDSVLLVPKTSVPPVIDAWIDDVWSNVSATYQLSYDNGTAEPEDKADLLGWYRVMWDDENFYGLFYSADESLWDTHANSWENDGWEIYFDSDHSQGATYDGVDDNQIRFEHKDATAAELDASIAGSAANIEFAQRDTLNGYLLEFRIPMDDIKLTPVADTPFGWEAQQNDNDVGTRDHISKWWLQTGDISWNNASVFGTAKLIDYTVGNELLVHKTTAVPVIDGVMENLWLNNSVEYTQNSYGNGAGLPDNYEDLQGEFRVMWDDNNFYGFFNSRDESLWDTHANSWENDGWEIYFDSDYSHGATYDGVDDNQIRFEHKDIAAADLDASIAGSAANIEFVQLEHGDGFGYDLEFKIPMDDLKLTPVEDTPFGFETQQNDNDVGTRDHISKWYLDTGDNSWNNASVFGKAILKGPKPYVVVGVEEKTPDVVREYGLSQNYPNPFNPGTNISYSLKNHGKVRLAVYDLTGREVAVLVNGVQGAGSYTVSFSGADLPSGVYLYKLQTANEVLTMKMALLK